MASPNGSARVAGVRPTPEQDAEDLGLVLREARETQGISAAELARRTDATASDVLEFEAGRVIPVLTGDESGGGNPRERGWRTT